MLTSFKKLLNNFDTTANKNIDKSTNIAEIIQALKDRKFGVVNTYIDNEGDVNAKQTTQGFTETLLTTALDCCKENNDKEMEELVKKLLAAGADTFIIEQDDDGDIEDEWYALHSAIDKKNVNIVKLLLENLNFDDKVVVNQQDSENGNTPLLKAIKRECFEIAKLLINKNADVTLANNQQSTPLDVVLSNLLISSSSEKPEPEQLEMLQLLLANGAAKPVKTEIFLQDLQTTINDTKPQIFALLLQATTTMNNYPFADKSWDGIMQALAVKPSAEENMFKFDDNAQELGNAENHNYTPAQAALYLMAYLHVNGTDIRQLIDSKTGISKVIDSDTINQINSLTSDNNDPSTIYDLWNIIKDAWPKETLKIKNEAVDGFQANSDSEEEVITIIDEPTDDDFTPWNILDSNTDIIEDNEIDNDLQQNNKLAINDFAKQAYIVDLRTLVKKVGGNQNNFHFEWRDPHFTDAFIKMATRPGSQLIIVGEYHAEAKQYIEETLGSNVKLQSAEKLDRENIANLPMKNNVSELADVSTKTRTTFISTDAYWAKDCAGTKISFDNNSRNQQGNRATLISETTKDITLSKKDIKNILRKTQQQGFVSTSKVGSLLGFFSNDPTAPDYYSDKGLYRLLMDIFYPPQNQPGLTPFGNRKEFSLTDIYEELLKHDEKNGTTHAKELLEASWQIKTHENTHHATLAQRVMIEFGKSFNDKSNVPNSSKEHIYPYQPSIPDELKNIKISKEQVNEILAKHKDDKSSSLLGKFRGGIFAYDSSKHYSNRTIREIVAEANSKSNASANNDLLFDENNEVTLDKLYNFLNHHKDNGKALASILLASAKGDVGDSADFSLAERIASDFGSKFRDVLAKQAEEAVDNQPSING